MFPEEEFDQPGDIYLLIGADMLYDVLRLGRRTRTGNFPVLQETNLGWTHCIRTPATTKRHDPKATFLNLEDSSLEHN